MQLNRGLDISLNIATLLLISHDAYDPRPAERRTVVSLAIETHLSDRPSIPAEEEVIGIHKASERRATVPRRHLQSDSERLVTVLEAAGRLPAGCGKPGPELVAISGVSDRTQQNRINGGYTSHSRRATVDLNYR